MFRLKKCLTFFSSVALHLAFLSFICLFLNNKHISCSTSCSSGDKAGHPLIGRSEVRFMAPSIHMSLCARARYLTSSCSWWAGWRLERQPLPPWMCVWMGECKALWMVWAVEKRNIRPFHSTIFIIYIYIYVYASSNSLPWIHLHRSPCRAHIVYWQIVPSSLYASAYIIFYVGLPSSFVHYYVSANASSGDPVIMWNLVLFSNTCCVGMFSQKHLCLLSVEKDEQQHCAEARYSRMHLAGDPEDNKVSSADSQNATAH